MKLAISNIAWAPQDSRLIYEEMRQWGFAGLEIAPGLAFAGEPDAFRPSAAAEAAFRADMAEFGLTPVSMQSLLFGVSGAQLFGSAQELAQLEWGLTRAIDLAGRLGIPNLVFGSPGNRSYPVGMAESDATAQAIDVFRRLGDKALAAGTAIAVEPNPAAYATNFLNTIATAADFVIATDHPAVTLNYDMGAMFMNGEDGLLGERAVSKISHVHISEPQLAAAPADAGRLVDVAARLLALGYDRWFSIEMRRPSEDVRATLSGCMERAATAMATARIAARAE